MRFSTFLAASAATVALCASAPALAAPFSPQNLGAGTSVDLSAAAGIFSQSTDNDVVFGVRARGVGSRPQGNGSFEILRPSVGSPSPTPTGACTVGANGWCDTPHHIAATAFGWDFSATGAGVIIGIVDTGIDLNHPDFAGRVLTGHCVTSSVNPCTSANDQAGGDTAVFPGPNATHGTHVAGIAAGAVTGLATSADILPVKVCSSTANSCAGVDDGILWASQHGASVINVSIGGPLLSNSDIAIFQQAVSNGSLIVVAAGNGGTKNPSGGFLAGAALKDGVRGSMIVVGATGAGGSGGHGQVSSFSQVPSTQCEVHAGVRYCMKDFFVVAPGANIWSTVGNGTDPSATYGYLSGTSMATPYVSGVAAVIKGAWPSLTSSQIASIIFQTTDDIGAPGVDPVYGRGAVDITKALSPVGPSVVANSSFSIAPGGSNTKASVTTAIGGGQGTAQTLAPFGVAGATTALASGPLAVAVRNSTILKSAVVVDSFGRTFHADLTQSSFNAPLIDIDNYMASGMLQSVRGFGGGAETPIGYVVASGFTVTTQTQRQYMGDALMGDHAKTGLYDFSASLGLTDGMSLDVGYNTRMAGRFNAYDATTSEAYDGLFFSASGVNSPYVSLTDGGNYVGTTMAVSGDVHVQFGASWVAPQQQGFEVPFDAKVDQLIGRPTQYDQRHAQSSMAAVTWDFASWGGLGMTVSQTDEQNGFLGGFTSGALSVNRSASTTAVGFSGRVGFGDGWVGTLSYSEGLTRLSLFDNGLVDGADPLKSRSYGVAIAKRGLFGDADSIGLALTRPIQVYSGGVDLAVATDADGNGNLIVSHEHVSLSSATPETDLEAGYATALFGGAMSLQANAAYQMNVNGLSGVNAVTFLSRASFTF